MNQQQQVHRVAVTFELCAENKSMILFSRPQDFRVKKSRWQYWTGTIQVLVRTGQQAEYEVHAYARRWKGEGREFSELAHDDHPSAAEMEALAIHVASTMGGFPIRVDGEDPVAWIDPLQEDDFLDEADNPDDFDFVADDDDDLDDFEDEPIGESDEEHVGQWMSVPLDGELEEDPDDEAIDFGPCCACEKADSTVRNIVALQKIAPVPNTGWGCFTCDLPMNGAQAVLCDACIETKAEIKFACKGYITEHGRIPVSELAGPFEHDMSKHAGER
jgi:hypothetical protein